MENFGNNSSWEIKNSANITNLTDHLQFTQNSSLKIGKNEGNLDVLTGDFLPVETEQKKQIIFINPKVEDYKQLIAGVKPGIEIVVLDPLRDGVEQITQVLANRKDIEAVHIVSHGSDGSINLGSTQLNNENLQAYGSQLQAWKKSLATGADLLIYGCDVAAGEIGNQFVQQLSNLTGADVAASTNLTGNSALGADWILEKQTGSIESGLAFEESALESYDSILAPCLTNQMYGVVAGSGGVFTEVRFLDLANATSTAIGNLSFNSFAMARDALTGNIYYVENVTNGRVAYFNPTTGANTTLSNTTGATVPIIAKLAQKQDGTIYAMSSSGSDTNLYTIDKATGSATNLGAITGGTPAFTGGGGDIAFDPNNADRLYVTVTDSAGGTFYRLYSVDTNPSSATFRQATFINNYPSIASTSGTGSLAFGPDGSLYANSTDNTTTPATPRLYKLDLTPGTGTATLIGNTGVVFSDFASLPTQTPNLAITVRKDDAGNTTAVPGSSITYTITVKNGDASNPSCDADGIKITDVITGTLTNITWTSQVTGGVTGNTATGTGNINETVNMPDQSQIVYTVTGTISPSATGTLSNTATVKLPNGLITTLPDGTKVDTLTATDTDTLTPRADLQITKSDGITSLTPGNPTTYTITVTNAGPSNVTGATVSDTFPAAITSATWTSTTAGGATATSSGTGNISDTVNLPVNSTITYTVTANTNPTATGTLANTATVTAPSGVTDPNTANNSATDTNTLTPSADLQITKNDGITNLTPGSPTTYTITVTNAGPSAVTGATVSDTFPAAITSATWTSATSGGATATSSGTGNISDTVNLPVNSTITYTVTANTDPTATGTLANTATVTAPSGVTDPNTANNSATDTNTLTPSANLQITKSDGITNLTPGS
ncbi:MAG: DUF4347 domain-containing protein, partial [Actinomycetota bacterium]